MIEKLIAQQPILEAGEISFKAETFSSGIMAPSNGLLSYRITEITTAKGEVIDASKLNGAFHNHYQLVMGNNMMAFGGELKGTGKLIEENGRYYVKNHSIGRDEGNS